MFYKTTIFFFLITTGVFSQNLDAIGTYKKISYHNFDKMLASQKQKDESMTKKINAVNEIVNELKYELIIKDSLAEYKELKKLKNDINNQSLNIARVFSGYKGPYYFNLNNNNILREKGKYLISKNLKDIKWNLSKESKIINGYKCYKATTTITVQGRRGVFERSVVAYYTPEINIPVGPDGFGGLPGLIIKLENNKVITILEKFNLNKKIKS